MVKKRIQHGLRSLVKVYRCVDETACCVQSPRPAHCTKSCSYCFSGSGRGGGFNKGKAPRDKRAVLLSYF